MANKTVFLSSTSKDLEPHRDAAYGVIDGLDGYDCDGMERFGARDAAAREFCPERVAKCDVFVGIVGHCYGSCPEGSDTSYTEQEYNEAVDKEKPRLIFLAPDDFPMPANLIEPEEKRQKQQAFRQRVGGERILKTFRSPEELAVEVVRGIYHWERTASVGGTRPTGRPLAIALPPTPHFAHPYPLQDNFTGRVCQRRMLTQWLAKGEEPVFAWIALGGMGKSALTWAWLLRDVLGAKLPGQAKDPPGMASRCRVTKRNRPEGVLWWSFYEREASFAAFVDTALRYASGGSVDPAGIPSLHERTEELVNRLRQRRILLVLDGFERELCAYASLNAAYQGDAILEDERQQYRACTDPHAGAFLGWLAAGPLAGRVLITSRLFPRELDGLPACRREDLTALDPDDAVAFFQAQGVTGNPGEIRAACEPYGYHPLAMRLLAGLIMGDPERPGDVAVAPEYDVTDELVPKEHHILQLAYNALDEGKQELLSRVAAFRSPMDYKAIGAISPLAAGRATKDGLRDLVARGLLLFDRQHVRHDLHPIVRRYAYDRLGDKQGVHTSLRDYFAAVPKLDEDKVQCVEDLNPVIELYHHTVRAGRYDEACRLFRDRFHRPLYYRFGAYQTSIELLLALFPDGEDRPPRLERESDQRWTLNTLANSYSLYGQSRRAVPLFEMQNYICENQDDKTNLAIGLGNIADDQLKLGQLEVAEGNLRRRIALCREIEDEFREAVGHQELGRLLSIRAAFDEADGELAESTRYWERIEDKQGLCLDEAYRALRTLLMGEPRAALEAARQARELADEFARTQYPIEADLVEVEWLLGWALVDLAAEEVDRQAEHLTEAEDHLTEALTRCRRINLVDHEPDILLAWARWHRLRGEAQPAHGRAVEALAIADRCEYRLKQADVHNFLAELALDADDRAAAAGHAQTAHERAWCDGPPHCYKPALDRAAGLLERLGITPGS